MINTNLSKQSLYFHLMLIIVLTVSILTSIHSAYVYKETKNKIVEKMKYDAKFIGVSLQKNLADLIASYTINEYNKLIRNAMDHRDNFAIIVEDYNTGKILGKTSYVSGQIRDDERNIIEFDPTSSKQIKQLKECYYSDKYDVTAPAGDMLGTVTVYFSDYSMNRELNDIIIGTIIDSVAISILLFLSLFLAIRRFVLKPLSDIIAVISNSDEDGIPLEFISTHGSREICSLSHTMNNMIASIRASRVTLKEQHNTLLEQKDALHYQANYDDLTKLPNRTLFLDRLQQALRQSSRSKVQTAVLFIDLDHFKEINDSLGHAAGDQVLIHIAQRLQDNLRNVDTIARLGGDEFTLIVENVHDAEQISDLAAKLIVALQKPIYIDEYELYVTSSVGISIYPIDGDTPESLLRNADAAMYKAKAEGRNSYQYYTADMTERAFERVAMEASLHRALKNEEFTVHYQPQFNGLSEKLFGMEVLVRWQHPDMGLVSPAKFIPLAEETGLIVAIDRFVMKKAMRQVAQWYREGRNPGVLSINLAMKQLEQDDFIPILEELVKETGCKPEWLELEVTEGHIMKNPEQAILILQKVSDLGIKIAIDDFGTGYSSLSYLKRLPIDKLKIDQSFVRDIPEDEDDVAIVNAVIALSKSLNLDVIAEGVETHEQKMFLVENGCENIQGYYYSRPVPADEMEQMFL